MVKRFLLVEITGWQGKGQSFFSTVSLAQAQRWKVRDFINTDTGGWNEPLIRQSFVFKDVVAISAMEVPNILEKDFLYWDAHPSGNLSIKSAYVYLQKLKKLRTENNVTQDHGVVYKLNFVASSHVTEVEIFYMETIL